MQPNRFTFAAEAWPPERSLAVAARHLPALARARVEATRVGVRPMPRDEKPIVGTIPGLEGFYVAVSHSGVTLGPLWGRIAAAEVLDGVRDAGSALSVHAAGGLRDHPAAGGVPVRVGRRRAALQ